MIPYTCNDTHKICSIFLGQCQIDNKILRYNVEEMIEEKTQGRRERDNGPYHKGMGRACHIPFNFSLPCPHPLPFVS